MPPKPGSKVVVAMSGGVDFSVAAALLHEQGFDVTGLMLRLWADPDTEFENRCCASNAVALAGRVAEQIAISRFTSSTRRSFSAARSSRR